MPVKVSAYKVRNPGTRAMLPQRGAFMPTPQRSVVCWITAPALLSWVVGVDMLDVVADVGQVRPSSAMRSTVCHFRHYALLVRRRIVNIQMLHYFRPGSTRRSTWIQQNVLREMCWRSGLSISSSSFNSPSHSSTIKSVIVRFCVFPSRHPPRKPVGLLKRTVS